MATALPVGAGRGFGLAEMTTRNFGLVTVSVVALALLLRVIYHLGTEPLVHIAGDINDYVRYAWNLGQHGVYSSAPINRESLPVPDSFRPPGYPFLLLLAMQLDGFGPEWTKIGYTLQIILSSATVLLTILLGREWMKPEFAIAAGALVALWPHHIVFASTLLSETLLGFCVVLALWLTAVAQRRASIPIAIAAGLALGYAALVNSLMLLFPFVVAVVIALKGNRKVALILLISALLLPSAWALTSSSAANGSHSSAHRATMNLIQGSWPIYHSAWRARNDYESARELMDEIQAEINLASEDPRAAFEQVSRRMSLDPAGYAHWYLLEKPYLLWDWDIQLGWGGIHFLPVKSTPIERHPVLRFAHATLKRLNPAFIALAALTVLLLFTDAARGKPISFAGLLVALFAVYVTGLHTVLQAEPRYSIPYRPAQMLLACSALAMFLAKVKHQNTEAHLQPGTD